jgi:predicted PurR-regulated permease PerM
MTEIEHKQGEALSESDWGSRNHVQTLVLMLATVLGVYLCYLLAAPLLWGLVMGLLAIIPMLGAFVVWAPAALFLALQGHWGSALILALWGMLVVGTVDNLLRPMLVGNRLKLHTVLVFLSVVGGLILFDPAGGILGPIVLTVTIALLEIWFNRNSIESEEL